MCYQDQVGLGEFPIQADRFEVDDFGAVVKEGFVPNQCRLLTVSMWDGVGVAGIEKYVLVREWGLIWVWQAVYIRSAIRPTS